MDKKIYIKELNYEGDNLLRPIIGDIGNYQKLCYRSFAALHEAELFFSLTRLEQSNWIEDNNHINKHLQYTLDEIHIVLAMFDMLIAGANIEWKGSQNKNG